ncbi:flagellin [Neobacillus sp. 19]|uniref:flagellin N-terminal helical domain-containing protein n=1 Tax=Neobacillus sp. 19 TaxID=3394458 RepID=UPI003BF6F50E
MIINHNLTAANTLNKMNKHEKATASATQKLSSGLRINNAADDASGMAISQKMKSQIRGLQQAEHNIQDGISLLQTADGGLEQIENPLLQRMRELAIQAANSTLSKEDRQSIQTEIEQIKQGINDLANNTNFNGIPLLNLPAKNINLQVGAGSGDTIKIELTDARTTTLGIDAVKVDPIEEAEKAIANIDLAFEKVLNERTKYGSYQNGLEHVLNNVANMVFHLTAANSRIEDADMAFESMELAKNNILFQASGAILAQANSQPNSVLQLLKQ